MQRVKLFCYMFMLINYTAELVVAQVSTILNAIHRQQGQLTDTINCLFDHTPTCIYEPRKPGQDTYELFLPLASVHKKCLHQAQLLEHNKNKYAVTIIPVTKPLKGLKIIVQCDAHKREIEYTVDQKRLIISVHDKRILQAIQEKKLCCA